VANGSQNRKKVVSPLEIRLTEIETRLSLKIDNLIQKFEEVSNGTGFPRCSNRDARITTVEREIGEIKRKMEAEANDEKNRHTQEVTRREFEKLERSFVWLRNIIVVGLLAAIFLKIWFNGATT
jgi:hypothetical protein